MDAHIRAYAWIHFAATARNVSSEQQAASQADTLLAEFDKRQFDTDKGRLEQELAVVNKAKELDRINDLTESIALPGETVPEVVERLVKASL